MKAYLEPPTSSSVPIVDHFQCDQLLRPCIRPPVHLAPPPGRLTSFERARMSFSRASGHCPCPLSCVRSFLSLEHEDIVGRVTSHFNKPFFSPLRQELSLV